MSIEEQPEGKIINEEEQNNDIVLANQPNRNNFQEEEEDSYNEEEEIIGEAQIAEGEADLPEYRPKITVAPGKSMYVCLIIISVLMVLNFALSFVKTPSGDEIADPEKLVKKLIADIGSQLYQGIGDRDLTHYYYNLQNLGHMLNLSDYKKIVIDQFRQSGLEYSLKKDLMNLASNCDYEHYRAISKVIFMVFNDFILNNYEISFDRKFIKAIMHGCMGFEDVTDLLFINLRALSYMGYYQSQNNAISVITTELPKMESGPWYNPALDYINKVVSETKLPQATQNKIGKFMDQIPLENLGYNAKTSYNSIKENLVCVEHIANK
ncbi:hypothetical protein TVAG_310020 [Trichomonas vaginalis G3]|uniref:Uncharacterized protein n=1 Tax=Trichomonas vaginalis (strain ATCC PRA-98 / G3) TaxID=412133 RepID=A2EKR8_TRIV3|nr:hypothetical protein TVAGG3_0865430 [Trichomonas vaginalis G3]EAY06715.1 hypothetical protein TVAG_310020 [Trichomonas vaginalis G3]KAI5500991.1 hypothetical protein TVAGG3_0865430 [Trichomonas vaginalis G3]|eukprot:XP_001318938.1 hypothetical protein [Trichomonas vaginalis G3]